MTNCGLHQSFMKGWTPVSVPVIQAAAEEILTATDRTLLKNNDGIIQLRHSGQYLLCKG